MSDVSLCQQGALQGAFKSTETVHFPHWTVSFLCPGACFLFHLSMPIILVHPRFPHLNSHTHPHILYSAGIRRQKGE